MSIGWFYLRTAWHNLRRGGQRVWVAVACIAFGVMSLVAMTLVSQSYNRSLIIKPAEQIGADISLSLPSGGTISSKQVSELNTLRQAGDIQRYTLVAYTSSLTYRLRGSGEMHFAASGLGINPSEYPLAGSLVISEPGNVGASTLLQAPGDILITADIARENHLHVGDMLVLADLDVGAPVEARIRGIAGDTPNHQGNKIYYSYATADRLVNSRQSMNTVLVNATHPEKTGEKLISSGWVVYTAASAAQNSQKSRDLIDMLLKGAGILGLLVGGVGVANTKQVLLRRRRQEVAILKALGYRESRLIGLFGVEALLLGASGSLVGFVLGIAISYVLLVLFSRTGNLLVAWKLALLPLLSALLAGILTTLVFALWSIVSTSRAKPLALLRNEPVEASRLPWFKSVVLALVLGVPFAAMTTLVMGSPVKGIGVLLLALTGLIFLGGFLGFLIWLAVRLLPLGWLPLARVAQLSLRRRGLSLVYAMIALFVGIVALSMGVVVVQNAMSTMERVGVQVGSDNLRAIAPASQEPGVRRALSDQKIETFNVGYQAAVKAIEMTGSQEGHSIKPVLVGRSAPVEYQLQGAGWDSRPEGVYTYQPENIPAGSQVRITFLDGSTRVLDVVGTYDIDWNGATLPPETGLLMSSDLAARLAQPELVTFFIQVPEDRLPAMSRALGEALPSATIINLQVYATRYTRQYQNLFVLALSMAGLALLAGVLLVANSVSLAMLDRRYEIGVLKAVGYSYLHVLVSLAVEYSLVALVVTLAGLSAVQVFLFFMGRINHEAGSLLVLSPGAAFLIVLCGVGLTLLTVLSITWAPARVSPVVVLNERV
ncbi:MAG: FtsX-like permease family protein [Omnitrophica WOR_2 bacterium]